MEEKFSTYSHLTLIFEDLKEKLVVLLGRDLYVDPYSHLLFSGK
jgi:hypothetical protein